MEGLISTGPTPSSGIVGSQKIVWFLKYSGCSFLEYYSDVVRFPGGCSLTEDCMVVVSQRIRGK